MYSTSQFEPATFQVLKGYMCLVATILDNRDLETRSYLPCPSENFLATFYLKSEPRLLSAIFNLSDTKRDLGLLEQWC